MSLILEALRKLEREKAAPEQRGFVVLGSPGSGRAGRVGLVALAAVAAIVVGALGAVVWHRLGSDPPPAPSEPAPAIEVVRGPVSSASQPPGTSDPPASAATDASDAPMPDSPRASDTSVAAAEPRFRLQAITRRDGRPVALLNDRLVREGDSFDGVRVVRIGELEIELETAAGRVVVGF